MKGYKMKKYELCSECEKKLKDTRMLEQGKLRMDIELCDKCYKKVFDGLKEEVK